jgi:hypothetical protein
MGTLYEPVSSFVSHKTFPRARLEGTEVLVIRGRDENKPARGRDGASIVRRAGVVNTLRIQLVDDTERNLPGNVTGVTVAISLGLNVLHPSGRGFR